ncbi:ABC transporter family protein [Aspergillus homomorphus CBS 101889]|uniref:ABC transporter family protein n=1 Tax=Aspergillus homomorphus (strain CBS 101889) TaxID=1450537 RepID=A0A395HRR5_ASPHC|nr:ABC transporter family protein [Aspergillus homomorphus CBS 101889]RAL10256.1 ABC transporter family protein [Aspergillus homomorphus CBS 101889]
MLLGIHVTAVGLSGIVGGRAALILAHQHRQRGLQLIRPIGDSIQTGYEDKDGVATPESIQAFSDKAPRAALFIGVGIGLCLSVTEVVVLTVTSNSTFGGTQWLRLTAWVMSIIATIALTTAKEYGTRFTHGCWVSVGCFALLAMLIVDQYWCYHALGSSFAPWFFLLTQFCTALGACIAAVSIPRRPDVYHNGALVDRKSSTSFLNRLSFGWLNLSLSAGQTHLEIKDIPELEYSNRTSHLCKLIRQTRRTQASSTSLWKLLLLGHRKALVFQLCLTCVNAVVAFAPQFAILNILQRLETDPSDPWLWLPVLGLGGSLILSALLENWNYYHSSNRVAVRLQEQLSAAIYDKVLRSKPARNVPAALSNDSNEQSTTNLVAVDAKRVADFSALGFMLCEAPLKIIMAALSIGRLLGVRSLAAGGVVFLLVTTGNVYAVRRYAGTQKNLLKSRDSKMTRILEVLQGIRQIKMSAWEDKWEGCINDLRDKELESQWQVYSWELLMFVTYNVAPILVSAACLGTYAMFHDGMPASIAFTSISLLGALSIPLAVLPQILLNVTGAQISLQRIERFLHSADHSGEHQSADDVVLEQATLSWTERHFRRNFKLRDLTLVFPMGALSVVTGPSGSGKSLILAAILGECEFLAGQVRRPPSSTIAYVGQQPCIRNGTVRDNILFGSPFDQDRYQRTIAACALDRDLEMLDLKDKTEMDAQGSNFSGGQIWRVSLARALYSNAEVLVLDDIFSSIDPHTAQHLYEHALMGSLAQGRTRILATYHLELCLPGAEYVVALDKTGLRYAGLRKNLTEIGIFGDMPLAAKRGETLLTPAKGALGSYRYDEEPWGDTVLTPEQDQIQRIPQNTRDTDTAPISKWQIRQRIYNLSGAGYHCLVLLALYIVYSGLGVGRGLWMMIWSNNSSPAPNNTKEALEVKSSPVTTDIRWLLSIYLALAIASCVTTVARSFLAIRITLQMSRQLFQRFLHSILRAPLQWLDKLPAGGILNNFSTDFSLIDSRLGYDLNYALGLLVDLLTITLAASIVNIWLNLLSLLSLSLAFYYGRQFIRKIRAVKELESLMRSPILDHVCATLDGIMTIRAYGQQETYRDEMHVKIDRHCRASWTLWLLTRWISVRASTIGAIFTTAGSALVLCTNGVTAATAGFAITFIMRYSTIMSQAIRQYANLEISLNSVERVAAALDTPNEKYDSPVPVAASWPTEGRLDVSDMTVCYSPDLPPVLSNLTFSIPPNTRVGIVGRTGAGKSSLAMALFRFLEAQEGSIRIDGVDVSTIPLHSLRSRLTIVPQDPILFSGTIKSNLDPFNEFSNRELFTALQRVHWTIPDTLLPTTTAEAHDDPIFTDSDSDIPLESLAVQSQLSRNVLNSKVAERGSNFSQGQRQCLCLARAILRRPKILVLDEATSAIEKSTDAVIQESIRAGFGRNYSSLLVIAHRLHTIVDFDRVLVLDAGRLVEYGSPRELVTDPDGVFRGLVESSVDREELMRVIAQGGEPSMEGWLLMLKEYTGLSMPSQVK